MTATTPSPATPVLRWRWAVSDGTVIAHRHMIHWVRDPSDVIIGLTVPIMMVLVFGFVFGSAMSVPGGGDYIDYLMPGMFALTMLQSVGGTGTSVANDMSRGVVDRFRSMPMAASAMVTGRSAADLLRGLLDIGVLIACGLLVGWRANGGFGAALAAVGLLLLLRFALTWVAIYLGLVMPNPDSVGVAVYPLAFPLSALSSIFVAPTAMPDWLGAITEWNPLSSTVAAARELFGGPVTGGGSWVAQHPLLMAVAWPLLITAVFAPLAVHRYRRLSR